jgi:hypothetical protein
MKTKLFISKYLHILDQIYRMIFHFLYHKLSPIIDLKLNKNGGVKLVLWAQTSLLSEIMQS